MANLNNKIAEDFNDLLIKTLSIHCAQYPDEITDEAKEKLKSVRLIPFPKERVEREKLIFRSYDSMNVNRSL